MGEGARRVGLGEWVEGDGSEVGGWVALGLGGQAGLDGLAERKDDGPARDSTMTYVRRESTIQRETASSSCTQRPSETYRTGATLVRKC